MCRPYILIIHKACNSAGLTIVPLLASSICISGGFGGGRAGRAPPPPPKIRKAYVIQR